MIRFLDIALIIIAVGLILSVILQSKGAGLGGFTGSDASTFSQPAEALNAFCSGSRSF